MNLLLTSITFIVVASIQQVFLARLPVKEESLGIVHGFRVDIKTVPYHASIVVWKHNLWRGILCGAVVIAPKALLTAAHCTPFVIPSRTRIQVGSSTANGGTRYNISKVIRHEDYDDDIIRNDIALIITTSEIEYTESVQPVPFASENYNLQVGAKSLATGFGQTEMSNFSEDLLAANLFIVSQKKCIESHVNNVIITDDMVCAAPKEGMEWPGPCHGDSGGPLVSNGTLVGIVSFGNMECKGQINLPAFTRVSYYHRWIVHHLNKLA